jgi:hypothetical protein
VKPETADCLVKARQCLDGARQIAAAGEADIGLARLARAVEGSVIKWDTKLGPEPIRIDDLNQIAKQLKAKTRQLRQFLHEIRNFQALRPLNKRT